MAAAEPIEPAASAPGLRPPAELARAAGATAALLAACLLAALLALGVAPRYDAGVTGGGGMATNKIGFYGLEYDRDGAPYRWTSGYAFVQMPYAYRAAPAYMAVVRLRAEHPGGPRPLMFLVNERPLAIVTPTARFRVYRLALPPPGDGAPELRLALSTEPFRPAENPRPLGVIVTEAALWPAPFTDWPLILTLAFGPAGLLLLLLARGQPLGPALLTAGLLGAGLLLLAWRAHPAPLRLEWLAWLALLAAGAAALLDGAWPVSLGLGALGALTAFSGALWPSWLTDDAFISFRYAQNLVAGHGLVYNLGERVEGYSNFLWTMLAALALALGADLVVATYAAGVALALALLLATFAIGRRLLGPGWALVAALLVGTSQSVLVYTARGGGLETGLFALLALLGTGVYLLERGDGPAAARPSRRAVAVGLLLGLATLTRPEGALLLALTALHALVAWTVGRGPVALPGAQSLAGPTADQPGFGAAAAELGAENPLLTAPNSQLKTHSLHLTLLAYAALVVPFFAWRLGYYGDLLPNTFYVKSGGGPSVWLRGLAYLGEFALDFGGPLLLLAPLAILLDRGRRPEDRTAEDQGPRAEGVAGGEADGMTDAPTIARPEQATDEQAPASDEGSTIGQQGQATDDGQPTTDSRGQTTGDEQLVAHDQPQASDDGHTAGGSPGRGENATSLEAGGHTTDGRWSLAIGLLQRWPGYLLLLCGAYAAYVLVVGGDHFPAQRFLVPIVPWLALLVAGGMAWAFERAPRAGLARWLAPAALALTLVAYSGYALTRSQRYDEVLAGNDESLWLWAEIGWWLHDSAAPGESVAAMGAGAIAYYSDHPVIDLLGLTERHIARVAPTPGAAAGHEKRDPAYVLDVRRPTYIPRIWDDYFGGAGALRGRYELITVTTRYGRQIELWRLR